MLLASASFDRTIRIWSTSTGELQHTLQGYKRCVTSVSLCRKSNSIVSASDDRAIRIWPMSLTGLQQTLDDQDREDSHVKRPYKWECFLSGPHDETVRIPGTNIDESRHKINIGICRERLPLAREDLDTLAHMGWIMRNYCQLRETGPNPFENSDSHCLGPGISMDRCWITWHGKNLLWLPEEFRPWCSAVAGSSIALGCDSGKAYLVKITGEMQVK